MPKLLFATTAMLLALGGQVMAQEQPETQNEQTPPGETAPDPGGAASTTGGVTAPAKEMLPGDTSETPVDPQTGDAAGSPAIDPAAAQPAAGTAGVVGADMVRELYEMALAQQKLTAAPPPPKSEEAKQAEQKAIAAHRDAFFARTEEAAGS